MLNLFSAKQIGFCLFVLRFYDPVNTIKAMSSMSVNLHTLFQGRLRFPKRLTSTKPLSAHTFASLLESTEWGNGCRNYFVISLHERYVTGLGLELTAPGSAVRHADDCVTEPGKHIRFWSVVNFIKHIEPPSYNKIRTHVLRHTNHRS